MGDPYKDNVELISMHSVSKGLMGECGLRGGYYETHNVDTYANEMLNKLKNIEICANTIGQLAVSLMVNPPKIGRESTECLEKYMGEKNQILKGLKERASLLTKTFNEMERTTCNNIEGAMYAFPQVHFSEKALKEASK